MLIEATNLRPLGKWVVVKGDPRVKKTKGGIELTEVMISVEKFMEGTGRVLRVGSTVRDMVGLDLVPGSRICYRGFLKDATAMQFESLDDCPVFLLHLDDVLAVISDDLHMGGI